MAEQKKKQRETKLERSIREGQEQGIAEVNEALARRVLLVVDHGLSSGAGVPIPGQMCVEAAVCYAMGDDHADSPSCVHDDVRWAKIALNDESWSGRKARALGLRRVAVAQLGTKNIDLKKFLRGLSLSLSHDILLPQLIDYAERSNKEGAEAVVKTLKRMLSRNDIELWDTELSGLHMLHGHSACHSLKHVMERVEGRGDRVIDSMDAWIHSKKVKMKRDERLKLIAACIEKVLVACESEGSRYLWLCD